jgi:cytosine/adenosine deaminase-related metal-dependent hydrolase
VNASESEATLLQAAWVAPMDGPPIAEGAVVFSNGQITDVGPAHDVWQRNPAAAAQDLGDVLLTPGLVNAHAHLELSEMTPGSPPASFADWLISVMSRLFDADDYLDAVPRAVAAGVEQCLRFGVTAVADITAAANLARPVLATSPLRGVSFGEVRAMAARRTELAPLLASAIHVRPPSLRMAVGISPHAPYTVEPDGYEFCLALAKRDGLMVTTHLAETPDEATFLRDHSGPLRRVWEWRGGWDDRVPTFKGGPIRFAKSLGLLDAPTLLAHVNYCDDGELALLAGGKASVAYCPRTHAYFAHPPHRWREMLALGINVCVGTDSCASSPDLNLLDDLRLLHRLAPEVPALELWKMATSRAAAAIGLGGITGTIRTGMAADLMAMRAAASDPLKALLETVEHPDAVWISGRRIDPL